MLFKHLIEDQNILGFVIYIGINILFRYRQKLDEYLIKYSYLILIIQKYTFTTYYIFFV